jgi:hypothetical protein
MRKLILILSIPCLIITLYSIHSCRKSSNKDKGETHSNILGKGLGRCDCETNYINPNCPDCINTFMGGSDVKNTTVTWTSCSSTDPLYQSGCVINGQAEYKSSVKFCYGTSQQQGSDCFIYMEISGNVPACLSNCLNQFTYCVKMRATCAQNGKDVNVTFVDEDPNLVATISYSITGDPIINICCDKVRYGMVKLIDLVAVAISNNTL